MACFGCKNTVREDFEEGWVKTGSLPKKKKKNRWISWSRTKKLSPAKTVSVSVSVSENLDSGGKSHLFKMDGVDVLPSKKHRHRTGVNAAANKPYKVISPTCGRGNKNHSHSFFHFFTVFSFSRPYHFSHSFSLFGTYFKMHIKYRFIIYF